MPELLPGAALFYEAFIQCSSDRPPSFGEQLLPIPLSTIDLYARRFGMADDPDEFMVMVRMLRAMDAEVLKFASAGNVSERPLTPDLFAAMFGSGGRKRR